MSVQELRSAAFKNPTRKRIKFKYNDCEFELLAPTVAIRKKIFHKTKKENPQILDLQVWTAIFCTVEPGTTTPIFTEEDENSFEEMTMEGFLDTVGSHIPELLNLISSPKIESAN